MFPFRKSVGLLVALAFVSLNSTFASSQTAESAVPGKGLAVDYTTSVSALKAYLKEIKAKKAVFLEKNPDDKLGAKSFRTDYYDAWLQRLQERAFPNDSLDSAAMGRAIRQREAMKAAPLPWNPQNNRTGAVAMGLPRLPGPVSSAPTWEYVGPRNLTVPYPIYYGPVNSAITGRVNGIAFDPIDPNIIYLAAAAGGIWKTSNNGLTWQSTGNNFPVQHTSSVAVDPNNREIVLAGTGDYPGGDGYGVGFMRSTNGGKSWTNVGRNDFEGGAINAILFDLEVPNRVYAASGRGFGGRGLWQSNDAGLTWARITVGSSPANESWIEIEKTENQLSQPNRLYAACSASGSSRFGIHGSLDGITWTQYTMPSGHGGNRFHIAASKISPDVLYLVSSGSQKAYKGVLTNNDMVWTEIMAGFPAGYNWSQAWYDFHMAAVAHTVSGQTKEYLYCGLITLSAWNGTSWSDIGKTYTNNPNTHNDQHAFGVFPGDSRRMAVGNDGGIYGLTISDNGTYDWQVRWNQHLGLTMFYDADYHPTDPKVMIGGTQDNASPAALGDLDNWVNPGAGDGCGSVISQLNPNIQYTSSQFYGLIGTTNRWNSSFGFNPDFGSDNVPFIGYKWMDPNRNVLYIGTNYLYRWNQGTSTWNTRVGGTELAVGGGQIRAVEVPVGDQNRIYVGTSNGYLWMTSNGGTNWTQINQIVSPALPRAAVLSISVNPTNKNEILVVLGGTGNEHVYKITSLDTNSPVLAAAGGTGGASLPSTHFSSITRDTTDPQNTWYAGSDIGVFMTVNAGAAWTNMTETFGLPTSQVTRVKFVPGTSYLMASTYGRGIWRINPRGERILSNSQLRYSAVAMKGQNNVTANVTVRNPGAAITDLRWTSAVMTVRGVDYAAAEVTPIVLGALAQNASATQALTFATGELPARTSGVLRLRGTFKIGEKTASTVFELAVRFP